MNLHSMQRDFRRWLTVADGLSARRLADGSRGLDVYQNNYRVQLMGCLEATYPHLRTFIGDAAFRHAAAVHIQRNPPRAWTLDAYGAGFEATLRTVFPDNPDLHELAWIEWSLATAFVARDAAPLDPARLAHVDWDRTRLGFAPSLQAPIPMTATPALAYARETTPPTALDLTFDRFGGKVTTADIHCMAEAIYFEARGESYKGQVAVGQVVMNRLAHPIYPKDICQVVFQNQQMRDACQFSFACDGRPETIDDPKSWRQADEIAGGVISGSLYLPEVGKATHYHATYVYPDWAPRLKRVTKIGHHTFYQFKSA